MSSHICHEIVADFNHMLSDRSLLNYLMLEGILRSSLSPDWLSTSEDWPPLIFTRGKKALSRHLKQPAIA